MNGTNLRSNGRQPNELRSVVITPHFTKYAEGSVLIQIGDTWVICTATVEGRVPPFLRGAGKGWITAEYGMLPRSTDSRTAREGTRLNQSGRTREIQRLIGRSLRAVVNLAELGERTITVDCDVIQADGSTRTTAITGGFVALVLALRRLVEQGQLQDLPITNYLAAVSVGLIGGRPFLDLNYAEDRQAEVDMNIVCTGDGRLVETQGTAESKPFTLEEMNQLLILAQSGINTILEHQRAVLGDLKDAQLSSVASERVS